MNTVVTSREAILCTSRQLIQQQGWDAVSIRAVAKACDISVGSIYNYFGSKSELLAATVESVWRDIFHFPEEGAQFDSFAACVEWAFARMREGEAKYPGFFSLHSVSFVGEDKAGGQQRMAQSWRHIRQALEQVLRSDPQLKPGVFDEDFTPDAFVELIFSLLLAALLQRSYDCAGTLGMIRRVLYEPSAPPSA